MILAAYMGGKLNLDISVGLRARHFSMTAIGKAQKSPKSAVIMYCRNTVRRGGKKAILLNITNT